MPYGTLQVSHEVSPVDPKDCSVLIVGQTKHLKHVPFESVSSKLGNHVSERIFKSATDLLHSSSTVDTFHLYQNSATLAALPSKCSRHNTPSRAHALTKIVKNWSTGADASILVICEYTDILASACAVARAFPRFSRKTSNLDPFKVTLEFVPVGDTRLSEEDTRIVQTICESIQLTARIVDTPCNEMHTDAFIEEVQAVAQELRIVPTIISGEDLGKNGFGGIYSVGQAALHPPALVVLSHMPQGAKETIAWVGKGIVYDTGGLSIKGKQGMPGMKRDCGGAAAILGAFAVAIKMGFTENLHAVFCLAENSVGPKSTRPDDIITLYSGRTVEVNNTDAEGRLVLGDGVAYAQKDLKADIILDMATLTGAQGTSTGKYHAAVITNNEDWEEACVKAGRLSGDLVHPLPFCPELHFSEFCSAVADMKNSVADRSNAQSSCAGLFIFSHVGFDFPGVWMHLDIASPVHCGERATGYGVSLLSLLFGHLMSNAPLLRLLAPMTDICSNDIESNSKKMRLE